MKRRNFIGSASLLAVPRLVSADDGEPQIFQEAHMGTMWTLKLFAPDEEIGRRAAADAFKRLAALDARLSDYRMDSELSQLSATAGSGKPRTVSRDLLTVLLLSQNAAAESGGLFDITLGACVQLWRESKKTRRLPSPVALAVARSASGWKSLEIDESTATVLLRIPGTRLDLGGIA